MFLTSSSSTLLAQMLKTQVDIMKVVAIITFSSNIKMTCTIGRSVLDYILYTKPALHFLRGLNESLGACVFDEQPHLFSRHILSKSDTFE